jgi:hypothetical protein
MAREKNQKAGDRNTMKCTACQCDFTEDEGGIDGYFGILYMAFCPDCLSCIYDMIEQINPRKWVGLTDEEIEQIYMDTMNFQQNARALEAKLKEANGYE